MGSGANVLASNLAGVLGRAAFYGIGWVRWSVAGVRLGSGARVSPRARLKGAYFVGKATIGSGVTMGEGSYVNSGEIFSGEIGRWCSLGYAVVIGPTEHSLGGLSSPAKALAKGLPASASEKHSPPPIIEDDVWIGANVVILRGTRVGRGSVVAAGAVVTGTIPPGQLWGGVPARMIRELASDRLADMPDSGEGMTDGMGDAH